MNRCKALLKKGSAEGKCSSISDLLFITCVIVIILISPTNLFESFVCRENVLMFVCVFVCLCLCMFVSQRKLEC